MINKMSKPELKGSTPQQLRESRQKERQAHLHNVSKQIISPEGHPKASYTVQKPPLQGSPPQKIQKPLSEAG